MAFVIHVQGDMPDGCSFDTPRFDSKTDDFAYHWAVNSKDKCFHLAIQSISKDEDFLKLLFKQMGSDMENAVERIDSDTMDTDQMTNHIGASYARIFANYIYKFTENMQQKVLLATLEKMSRKEKIIGIIYNIYNFFFTGFKWKKTN